VERITSVLGAGVIWQGSIVGSGGVRIEGSFEGQIAVKGLLVVGETGKVTCENVRAANVIVAGAVKGNITAHKVEIRSSGRVWGNIIKVPSCAGRFGWKMPWTWDWMLLPILPLPWKKTSLLKRNFL
jgi:hypothetical protein